MFFDSQGSLEFNFQQWRALEIYEGSDALNQTGYILRYSNPLAKLKIDILYLSTYKTDLILVEEKNIAASLNCLQAIEKIDNQNLPGLSQDSNFAIKLNFDLLPFDLCLLGFDAKNAPMMAHQLIKLFLFPNSPHRFFSYTSYDSEITLVIEKDQIDLIQPFINDILLNEYTWNVLHMQASVDGISSQVISHVAKLLSTRNISIYYLSSMNNDYILIPKHHMKEALQCLGQ